MLNGRSRGGSLQYLKLVLAGSTGSCNASQVCHINNRFKHTYNLYLQYLQVLNSNESLLLVGCWLQHFSLNLAIILDWEMRNKSKTAARQTVTQQEECSVGAVHESRRRIYGLGFFSQFSYLFTSTVKAEKETEDVFNCTGIFAKFYTAYTQLTYVLYLQPRWGLAVLGASVGEMQLARPDKWSVFRF